MNNNEGKSGDLYCIFSYALLELKRLFLNIYLGFISLMILTVVGTVTIVVGVDFVACVGFGVAVGFVIAVGFVVGDGAAVGIDVYLPISVS